MKTFWIFFLACLFVACGQSRSTTDTYTLPREAREFLEEHYNRSSVDEITVEKYLVRDNSYDVELSDGTVLTFNEDGRWTRIESEKGNIPYSVPKPAVGRYITLHYPRQPILSVEKHMRGYDVHLRNGMDLRFSNAGEYRDPVVSVEE